MLPGPAVLPARTSRRKRTDAISAPRGKVLHEELRVPRGDYFFVTKGAAETDDDMKRVVENQLRTLRLDYIDLYAWHGINTPRRY